MSVRTSTKIGTIDGMTAGVLFPGTVSYEVARERNTPDQYPAAIIEAHNADEVRAGVLAAQELQRPLAIRATGHGSVAVADGAVLISTASMTGIDVDPARRLARVAPGVRWSQVIAAAEPYGLSPTCGDFPGVWVTGFTTGGGVGWLTRSHGYAADNLISATLILSDGRSVTVDSGHHADLFWAIRGGSGNFGVITELEIRLAPVSRVLAGVLTWPIEAAADVLRWFADHADRVPDEVTLAPVLRAADPGTERPALTVGLVALDQDKAAPVQAALRRVGDVPARERLQTVRYSDVSIPGTRPRGFEMYDDLTDNVIDHAVEAVAAGRADALEFRHWGGAASRPAGDHGPVGHRGVPFSIKIDAGPRVVDELAGRATGAKFLNFLSDTTQTPRAYRVSDYYRLRELKRRYDPTNLLRVNHNIPPA